MTDGDESAPSTFGLKRYLKAKQTVDDRAVSQRVIDCLREELHSHQQPRILDFGAGLGYTLDRLISREVFPAGTEYVGVELAPDITAAARDRLTEISPVTRINAKDLGAEFAWPLDDEEIRITFQTGDGYSILTADAGAWDLVIAQAFLAEPNIDAALQKLADSLRPGGVCYFPMVFDGITRFEPSVGRGLDEKISDVFHASLDRPARTGHSSGNSRAGRAVIQQVGGVGGEILAVASADWVIYPDKGEYPGDERYVLHQILESIRETLEGHPELNAQRVTDWVETRRQQINSGELIYISHRFDILAKFP